MGNVRQPKPPMFKMKDTRLYPIKIKLKVLPLQINIDDGSILPLVVEKEEAQ